MPEQRAVGRDRDERPARVERGGSVGAERGRRAEEGEWKEGGQEGEEGEVEVEGRGGGEEVERGWEGAEG